MEVVYTLSRGKRLRVIEGDITLIPVDAMANAANATLSGGGGVDGAIHRAGGPTIMDELDDLRPRIGKLARGNAVATSAGALPARFVFHAVGPIYKHGNSGEPEALAACYRNCLLLADERACRTLSFPAISTGAFGYPMQAAAEVAVPEVVSFLDRKAHSLEEVLFVLPGEAAFDIYVRILTDAGL